MIGNLPVMAFKPPQMLWELINRLAHTILTIRISGRNASDNEAVARLIAGDYPHDNAAFLKFNCKTLELHWTGRPPAQPGGSPVKVFKKALSAPQYHVFYLEHIEGLPGELQEALVRLFGEHYSSAPPWIIATSDEPLENYLQAAGFARAVFNVLDTIQIELPPLDLHPEQLPRLSGWLRDQDGDINPQYLDGLKASYLLWHAGLKINRERLMEGLMTAANLDKIGLLDLAIIREAVCQIADRIDARQCEFQTIDNFIADS
jgi:transcriptional regulator of acetoin/glycerol metabolism